MMEEQEFIIKVKEKVIEETKEELVQLKTWLTVAEKDKISLKRLDYIGTRSYISRFISSCRSFRSSSSLFDTDHYMVKMTFCASSR